MSAPAVTLTLSAAELQARAERVRLVAFDIDGTLTDGGLYFSAEGELCKRFDVRDGFGLTLLREAGLLIAIVTGRSSALVQRRGEDLGFDAIIQGSRDKHAAMLDLCTRFGLTPAECAFVGDDWPDLPALRHVGLAAAVAGASAEVLALAHWVSTAPAGRGAVREFCEWLLDRQGRLDELRDRHSGS